jgi:WD40 repeat protein
VSIKKQTVIILFGIGVLILIFIGIRLYFKTPPLIATLRGHQGGICHIAFSPDNNWVASCGKDMIIRIWNLHTKNPEIILQGHSDKVVGLAFSQDLIASASWDGTVKLWDLRTAKVIETIISGTQLSNNKGSQPVVAVAFSPDGKLLAFGGGGGTLNLWNLSTKTLQQVPQQTSKYIMSLVFSSDGLLASRTYDGIITIWDTENLKQLNRLGEKSSGFGFYRMAFSPGGEFLVYNDILRNLIIWNMARREETRIIKTDLKWPINSIVFFPNGKIIATGVIIDETLRIWDSEIGKLLSTFRIGNNYGIAISQDGKTLGSIHQDGSIKLWDISKLLDP